MGRQRHGHVVLVGNWGQEGQVWTGVTLWQVGGARAGRALWRAGRAWPGTAIGQIGEGQDGIHKAFCERAANTDARSGQWG